MHRDDVSPPLVMNPSVVSRGDRTSPAQSNNSSLPQQGRESGCNSNHNSPPLSRNSSTNSISAMRRAAQPLGSVGATSPHFSAMTTGSHPRQASITALSIPSGTGGTGSIVNPLARYPARQPSSHVQQHNSGGGGGGAAAAAVAGVAGDDFALDAGTMSAGNNLSGNLANNKTGGGGGPSVLLISPTSNKKNNKDDRAANSRKKFHAVRTSQPPQRYPDGEAPEIEEDDRDWNKYQSVASTAGCRVCGRYFFFYTYRYAIFLSLAFLDLMLCVAAIVLQYTTTGDAMKHVISALVGFNFLIAAGTMIALPIILAAVDGHAANALQLTISGTTAAASVSSLLSSSTDLFRTMCKEEGCFKMLYLTGMEQTDARIAWIAELWTRSVPFLDDELLDAAVCGPPKSSAEQSDGSNNQQHFDGEQGDNSNSMGKNRSGSLLSSPDQPMMPLMTRGNSMAVNQAGAVSPQDDLDDSDLSSISESNDDDESTCDGSGGLHNLAQGDETDLSRHSSNVQQLQSGLLSRGSMVQTSSSSATPLSGFNSIRRISMAAQSGVNQFGDGDDDLPVNQSQSMRGPSLLHTFNRAINKFISRLPYANKTSQRSVVVVHFAFYFHRHGGQRPPPPSVTADIVREFVSTAIHCTAQRAGSVFNVQPNNVTSFWEIGANGQPSVMTCDLNAAAAAKDFGKMMKEFRARVLGDNSKSTPMNKSVTDPRMMVASGGLNNSGDGHIESSSAVLQRSSFTCGIARGAVLRGTLGTNSKQSSVLFGPVVQKAAILAEVGVKVQASVVVASSVYFANNMSFVMRPLDDVEMPKWMSEGKLSAKFGGGAGHGTSPGQAGGGGGRAALSPAGGGDRMSIGEGGAGALAVEDIGGLGGLGGVGKGGVNATGYEIETVYQLLNLGSATAASGSPGRGGGGGGTSVIGAKDAEWMYELEKHGGAELHNMGMAFDAFRSGNLPLAAQLYDGLLKRSRAANYADRYVTNKCRYLLDVRARVGALVSNFSMRVVGGGVSGSRPQSSLEYVHNQQHTPTTTSPPLQENSSGNLAGAASSASGGAGGIINNHNLQASCACGTQFVESHSGGEMLDRATSAVMTNPRRLALERFFAELKQQGKRYARRVYTTGAEDFSFE